MVNIREATVSRVMSERLTQDIDNLFMLTRSNDKDNYRHCNGQLPTKVHLAYNVQLQDFMLLSNYNYL